MYKCEWHNDGMSNKYDNVATNKFVRVNRDAAAVARLEELSEIIMSFRVCVGFTPSRVAASRICRRVQYDNPAKCSWKLLRIGGSTLRQIKIIEVDNRAESKL